MVNGEKDPLPTDAQSQYVVKSTAVEKEQIELQRAEEAQLETEKNLGIRLRRLTYLLLGVFTVAYIALFFWLNQETSKLAIDSVKNQMLALVETTVCFMYGDQFEPFINSYSSKDNSVYEADYYKSLAAYMENVKSMNQNIAETDIVLYTVIKGSKADEYLVVNSTRENVDYKTVKSTRNANAAQIVGIQRTVVDTTTVSENENGIWISACSPILNSKGESVGALCADFNARLLQDTRQKVITTLGFAFIAIYPAMILLVLFVTRNAQKAKNPA
jgi:preprotein translocase subunit SecG